MPRRHRECAHKDVEATLRGHRYGVPVQRRGFLPRHTEDVTGFYRPERRL